MYDVNSLLLFGMPGPLELVVILLIVLLVVGPKRLPELMRAIGKSIQSFKQGMKEGESDKKISRSQDEPSDDVDG